MTKSFGTSGTPTLEGLLWTANCKIKTNVLPYPTFSLYNMRLELWAKPYGITKVLLTTFLEKLGNLRNPLGTSWEHGKK